MITRVNLASFDLIVFSRRKRLLSRSTDYEAIQLLSLAMKN
jgi:hypothetical protein